MANSADYDYVIVGAGSAGCTLANRLTEDSDVQVLLIEAGGWDTHPWIHIPLAWGRILQKRLFDWDYFAEPDAKVGDRRIECARGKVIGGSSSINAMAHVRGNRADYDRWASYGLPDWSFDQVLPYFRKQESWEDGVDFYRGGDGPLTTRRSQYQDPIVQAFIQAGISAGYSHNADYNAQTQEGFGLLQSTIRNGRRCSAAAAYLHPALKRRNLKVEVRAVASRVLFDKQRASAVEYLRNGQRKVAYANCEVILAGGVINTPQLLMLSGIGDPVELQAHSIKVVARPVASGSPDRVAPVCVDDERKPLPVGRPGMVTLVAVVQLGQAPQVAAIGIHQEKLAGPASAGQERDGLAIR